MLVNPNLNRLLLGVVVAVVVSAGLVSVLIDEDEAENGLTSDVVAEVDG